MLNYIGQTIALGFDLAMTSWNVLPGRRLAVVVGTKDNLYKDLAQAGETVTILSGSTVEIPLHN